MSVNGLNYERVFRTLDEQAVEFILIGGLNYFFHYRAVTTQDIDIYVRPTQDNISRCEVALTKLNAEWGRTDDDWGSVAKKPPGWLRSQSVFCLLSDCGPIDIFLRVVGLESFESVVQRANLVSTRAGTEYRSLAAEDMLACQLALPESEQRAERVRHLQEIIEQ